MIIKGNPDLHVSVHAKDHFSSGEGGGGNASAANWLVNAIPGVHQGKPGVLTIMDIPRFTVITFSPELALISTLNGVILL